LAWQATEQATCKPKNGFISAQYLLPNKTTALHNAVYESKKLPSYSMSS